MTRALPACAGLLLALGCMPGTIDPALEGLGNPTCNAPQIFSKYMCALAGCHDASGSSAKFDMASAGWETRLVGVNPMGGGAPASMCMPMGPYLMAGTGTAQGLFIRKLTAAPGCGNRMPFLAGTYLTQTEMNCVQSWADMLVAMGPSGGGDAAVGQ